MSENDTVYITVGKTGAPYGVRGWVKVHSYTDPVENLLTYKPWYLNVGGPDKTSWINAENVQARLHGNGIVAKFEGCDDRDAAAQLGGQEIAIRRNQLPEPEKGQYYWADLVGLEVVTLEDVSLGNIDRMMATGANDVMVVKGQRERLIPYVMDHIVHEVDLTAGILRVDWDPDFE